MSRRRLQVEALRDGLLAMSGQLDPSPAESVVAEFGVQATGVGVKPNKQVPSVRRTVYLPVIRNDLPALFQLFDFGDSLSVNGRRSTTNVAPQALFMMNSPLVLEAATARPKLSWQAAMCPTNTRLLERLYATHSRASAAPRRNRAVAGAGPCSPVGVGGIGAEVPIGGRGSARVRAWAILSHALFCSTSFQYLD